MTARTTLASLLITTTLLLGACASPTRSPGNPMGDKLVQAGEYPKVAASRDLHKYLMVGNGVVTSDGVMTVSVDVRAATEKDTLNVQYRFAFLDENNRAINPSTGWRFQQLPPRVLVTLQGNALDAGAADWRLHIRPAE